MHYKNGDQATMLHWYPMTYKRLGMGVTHIYNSEEGWDGSGYYQPPGGL